MIAYSMAVAPRSFFRKRTPSLMRPLTGRLPQMCPPARPREPHRPSRVTCKSETSLATIDRI
jgi:hypothetical protein